jgi:hypothetical protein
LNFPILRLSLQNPRIIFKKKKQFATKEMGAMGICGVGSTHLLVTPAGRPV